MKDVVSRVTRRLVNLKPLVRVDKTLRALLYPAACMICGHAAETAMDCCAACLRALPRPVGRCAGCALALPVVRARCGACTRRPPPFATAFAPFVYQSPVDHLVQAFKFRRDLAAGRLLADLFAAEAGQYELVLPEALVPVPLHPLRQLRRGFNQADFLAGDIGRLFGGLPVAHLLKRRRRTVAQSGLAATRRAGNVRGAFACRRLSGTVRHVALVDDVMTTGATVAECARVLKRAGVARVDVWVMARA